MALWSDAGCGGESEAGVGTQRLAADRGYLVAEISTNFKRRLYAPLDADDVQSTRPDFAMAIYPGHLARKDDKLNPNDGFGLRATKLPITHWPKLADAWLRRIGVIP